MKGLKSAIKWIVAIVIICVVATFLASINGLNVSRTIITVNGSEITEEEYKFYLETAKLEVFSDNGIADEEAAKEFLANGNVEGKPVADYIKEKAYETATRNEIAVAMAKAEGISLTDEERSSARSTEGMEDQIKETYGISAKTYADIMEKSTLIDKYFTDVAAKNPESFEATPEEISAAISENYALVQHILIMNAPQDGSADENYATEAKKKAEEVLEKAKTTNNFEALVKEYGEDPGMESNPEGYLITKTGYTLDGQSQMVEPFTKGAFAVEPGNVNPELVESDYGWHIIKRCVISESNADYAQLSSTATSNIAYEKFFDYLDTLRPGMEIVKKDSIINKIKIKY